MFRYVPIPQLPAELIETKRKCDSKKLPFGQSGNAIVRAPANTGAIDVNIVMWVDSSLATVLTTMHSNDADEQVLHMRRQQMRPSMNAKNAAEAFVEPRELRAQPSALLHYNLFMSGVDIADQARKHFTCRQTSRKSWLPTFWLLVDTAIINTSHAFVDWMSQFGGKPSFAESPKETAFALAVQLHKWSLVERERERKYSVSEPSRRASRSNSSIMIDQLSQSTTSMVSVGSDDSKFDTQSKTSGTSWRVHATQTAGVSAAQLPDASTRCLGGTHERQELRKGIRQVSNVRCSCCRFIEGSSSKAKRAQWQCMTCSNDERSFYLCGACWPVWHTRKDLNKVRQEKMTKRGR